MEETSHRLQSLCWVGRASEYCLRAICFEVNPHYHIFRGSVFSPSISMLNQQGHLVNVDGNL